MSNGSETVQAIAQFHVSAGHCSCNGRLLYWRGASAVRESLPYAKSFHEQSEGRRQVATAWVVEVTSAKRWTPVLGDPNQLSSRNVWKCQVLGHVGQPETLER